MKQILPCLFELGTRIGNSMAALILISFLSIEVLAQPTLSGITQTGPSCDSSTATIALSGLVANSTFDVTYKVGSSLPQVVAGVVAVGTDATFSVPVVKADSGKTLSVIFIQTISPSPGSLVPISGNTVVLYVHSRPTASITSNEYTCPGQTAPIFFSFTGKSPWNMVYTYNQEDTITYPPITTTDTITITFGPADYGVYKVISLTDAHCSTTRSGDLDEHVIVVPNPCAIHWNGSQGDHDWDNRKNWTPDNAPPSSQTSVIIPDSVPYPEIAQVGYCHGMYLEGDTVLIRVKENARLRLYGDVFADSVGVIEGPGQMELTGNSSSPIYFGQFRISNLKISKPVGPNIVISPEAEVRIIPSSFPGSGLLSLDSGSKLTIQGKLVLGSDSTGTARIGPIPPSATLTGEITQERYLPWSSGTGSWYLMGTPISADSLADLCDDFRVTLLPYTSGSCVLQTLEPTEATVLYHDESSHNIRTDSIHKLGWRYPTLPILRPGKGMKVWVDHASNPSHLVDFTGKVVRNEFTFPTLSHSPFSPCWPEIPGTNPLNCNTRYRGFNLLSNPYPCDIDWDAPTAGAWTKPSQLNNALYTWDAKANGYRAYLGGGGPELGCTFSSKPHPSIIPSGQGFFVHLKNPGTDTLKVGESAKSITGAGTFSRTAVEGERLHIRLTKPVDTTYQFDAMLRLEEGSTDAFDGNRDMALLPGSRLQVGFRNNFDLHLLQSIAPTEFEKTLPLEMEYSGDTGTFQFAFTDRSSIDTATTVHLHDKYLNQLVSLNADTTLRFSVIDSLSALPYRFDLILNLGLVSVEALTKKSALILFPNPYPNGKPGELMLSGWEEPWGNIQIMNALGQVIVEKQLTFHQGKAGFKSELLKPGVFWVRCRGDQKTSLQKLVVE